MKKLMKTIGYTAGTFDMLHAGHLNLLKNAESMCDYLVVGVSTDESVKKKGKKTVMPFEHRIDLVRSLRYVDSVIPQNDIMDKLEVQRKINFDILFVGDDYYNKSPYKELEVQLKKIKIRTIYFPYTKDVSSTKYKKIISHE